MRMRVRACLSTSFRRRRSRRSVSFRLRPEFTMGKSKKRNRDDDENDEPSKKREAAEEEQEQPDSEVVHRESKAEGKKEKKEKKKETTLAQVIAERAAEKKEFEKRERQREKELRRMKDEAKNVKEQLIKYRTQNILGDEVSLGSSESTGGKLPTLKEAKDRNEEYKTLVDRIGSLEAKKGEISSDEYEERFEILEKKMEALEPDYISAKKVLLRPSTIGMDEEVWEGFRAHHVLKIPASLFCQVFRSSDSLQSKVAEEEKKLERKASRIAIQANIVKRHFSGNKTDMNGEIRKLLSSSGVVFIDASVGGYPTDGICLEEGRPLAIVENKLPMGKGDPLMQGLASYKYGRDDYLEFLDGLCEGEGSLSLVDQLCPCLLVVSHGEAYAIYGVVTLKPRDRENPGIAYSLLKQFSIEQPSQAVGMVAWLNVAIKELHSYYADDANPSQRNHFPVVQTTQIPLTSSVEFHSHLQDVIFRGKHDGKECYVKFLVSFYGKAAHEHCVSEDIAPKILAYERISSYAGPIFIVVMECDESFETLGNALKGPDPKKIKMPGLIKKRIRKNLKAAVKCLHEANFVHGDIRPPNVLVNRKGGVRLNYFDWAEEKGFARYPHSLNKDSTWPAGAKCGEFITRAHDEFMMGQILEKLK